jgi:predicted transcriptional regulator|nr:MAG TPA: hypothetical protein [Caudoviricetes sp.]
MRSSKPKYSQMQNQELETKAFMVLAQTTQALTIPEICGQDFALSTQTPQKMARVLNNLCDMGAVIKAKDKSKGRMVYMSMSSYNDMMNGDNND